jgi:hypothetical protein
MLLQKSARKFNYKYLDLWNFMQLKVCVQSTDKLDFKRLTHQHKLKDVTFTGNWKGRVVDSRFDF